MKNKFKKTDDSLLVEKKFIHETNRYEEFYTNNENLKSLIWANKLNNKISAVSFCIFLLSLLPLFVVGLEYFQNPTTGWCTATVGVLVITLVSLILTIFYYAQDYMTRYIEDFELSDEYKWQYDFYVWQEFDTRKKLDEEKRKKKAEQIVNITKTLNSHRSYSEKIDLIMEELK